VSRETRLVIWLVLFTLFAVFTAWVMPK